MSFRGSFLLSVLLHMAFVVAIIWDQQSEIYDGPAAGFPGIPGGGGGGGGPAITYVALASPAAAPNPTAAKVPTLRMLLPVPQVEQIARNEPRVIADLPKNIRPIQLARTIGAGAGTLP